MRRDGSLCVYIKLLRFDLVSLLFLFPSTVALLQKWKWTSKKKKKKSQCKQNPKYRAFVFIDELHAEIIGAKRSSANPNWKKNKINEIKQTEENITLKRRPINIQMCSIIYWCDDLWSEHCDLRDGKISDFYFIEDEPRINQRPQTINTTNDQGFYIFVLFLLEISMRFGHILLLSSLFFLLFFWMKSLSSIKVMIKLDSDDRTMSKKVPIAQHHRTPEKKVKKKRFSAWKQAHMRQRWACVKWSALLR